MGGGPEDPFGGGTGDPSLSGGSGDPSLSGGGGDPTTGGGPDDPFGGSGGDTCSPSCGQDSDCQATCSAPPSGQVYCCEAMAGMCYLENTGTCPGNPGGSSSSSTSGGGLPPDPGPPGL